MNISNPFEFNFSADESGAVQKPGFNFLIKTLGSSFLGCLLIVLIGDLLIRMPERAGTWPLIFAIVIFVPVYQTARFLRLPGQVISSPNRAFVFGIGAIVAIVGTAMARRMLFPASQSPVWFSISAMALTTSILLIVLRRIVFGIMKWFPLTFAILPTSVVTLVILVLGAWRLAHVFPDLYVKHDLSMAAGAVCLYAHIVCAAWWLSDKPD